MGAASFGRGSRSETSLKKPDCPPPRGALRVRLGRGCGAFITASSISGHDSRGQAHWRDTSGGGASREEHLPTYRRPRVRRCGTLDFDLVRLTAPGQYATPTWRLPSMNVSGGSSTWRGGSLPMQPPWSDVAVMSSLRVSTRPDRGEEPAAKVTYEMETSEAVELTYREELRHKRKQRVEAPNTPGWQHWV
ncbi:hypothetical protein MTO96_049456 [Rhipicephalus appendiculatus]